MTQDQTDQMTLAYTIISVIFLAVLPVYVVFRYLFSKGRDMNSINTDPVFIGVQTDLQNKLNLYQLFYPLIFMLRRIVFVFLVFETNFAFLQVTS